MSSVQIELDNSELWQKFHEHTTEMVVTKGGRRMFPTLRYRVFGLDPNSTYSVLLELDAVTDCRFKFQNGRWVVAGRADPSLFRNNSGAVSVVRTRTYVHPDSPISGRIWMRQPVSFHRIKLTNNLMDTSGNVQLNSMHQYKPRVLIVKLHDHFPSAPQLVGSASFIETAFIAVTAYQNEKIIQLKVDHNPFAKGFRDNGGAERKRLGSHIDEQRAPKRDRKEEDAPVASKSGAVADNSDDSNPMGAPDSPLSLLSTPMSISSRKLTPSLSLPCTPFSLLPPFYRHYFDNSAVLAAFAQTHPLIIRHLLMANSVPSFAYHM